jgi:DNA helicase IV
VVDEAQDIRPLEWMILQAVNAGGWTLLGDINQRRVDHSDDDWRVVGKRLGFGARDVKAGYRELDLGFRSTRQIMAFASGLLPLKERGVRSLQEGPEPIVVKTTKSALARTVVDQAISLAERYANGLVAVIDVEADRIAETLRADGWAPCRIGNNWTRGDRKLYLRRPEEARGVEYDAVVVVEPDRFPCSQGQRRGVLYTSLTRANRELVVIPAGKLPRELSQRRLKG